MITHDVGADNAGSGMLAVWLPSALLQHKITLANLRSLIFSSESRNKKNNKPAKNKPEKSDKEPDDDRPFIDIKLKNYAVHHAAISSLRTFHRLSDKKNTMRHSKQYYLTKILCSSAILSPSLFPALLLKNIF